MPGRYHLGISYGHNATVAVIADGRLIFCQSEERLNRIKNSTGFPWETLAHVYRHVCAPHDVASCSMFMATKTGYLVMREVGFRATPFVSVLNGADIDAWRADLEAADGASEAYDRRVAAWASDPATVAEADTWFAKAARLPASKIFHVDHHVAHALSSLAFADDGDDRLIFTLDGEGDELCATVSQLRDGELVRLSATPRHLSLGKIYELVTGLLGFKMMEHEYKVMGLAPYAKPEYCEALRRKFEALLWVDEDGAWRGSLRGVRSTMVRLAELCRLQRFDAVAGALQDYAERMICAWIGHWVRRTGIGSIACAGGVFMNVKANQRVLATDGVERMVVVPSCGDESTAIGCAVFGSRSLQPELPIEPVRHLYLGQSYADEDVERLLRDGGLAEHLAIAEPADLADAIARLLADGEIVARCAGPMEFGARALGNRSILSHPGRTENIAVINEAIKNRDFWMPFAPTVLDDEVESLVRDGARMFSPFMMVSFDSTERGRRDLGAALHRADWTLRPQMLVRDANPGYYAIIEAFRRRTGIGAVLNTSFNLHGEPIVGSPLDAIRTMANSGLRHLALNKFLISKPLPA
ncbi:MAG TPA: carbamoyltransferase C-terminal domain-containing protein [Candidatus Sulfotelmatobacter sp.]|nr:carbamoyltransferase C-terminal domain-containing protein [Candidatus Sulfotelmatobacter sp.]